METGWRSPVHRPVTYSHPGRLSETEHTLLKPKPSTLYPRNQPPAPHAPPLASHAARGIRAKAASHCGGPGCPGRELQWADSVGQEAPDGCGPAAAALRCAGGAEAAGAAAAAGCMPGRLGSQVGGRPGWQAAVSQGPGGQACLLPPQCRCRRELQRGPDEGQESPLPGPGPRSAGPGPD